MSQSRIPSFYKFSVANRLRVLLERNVIDQAEYDMLIDGTHMLDADQADRLIENVISVFGLPMGLGLNFQVNDRDYLVPMVVEEPSIIAAVSSAAKLVRSTGGFTSTAERPLLIGQIQVVNVPHAAHARQALLQHSEEILNLANSLHPNMVARGGGAREIEVYTHGATAGHGDMLVVHLLVDTRDAMGANLVNTMCEGAAPLVEKISGGRVFLRILSNLADRALVRSKAVIPVAELAAGDYSGAEVRDGIILANEFAERDPYRATTHNKGIMNGIDAVAIATGNDWRAIEAAAHAYAARTGRYSSLTRWYANEAGDLVGELEIPLKVGTVGGQVESNQAVRIAHRVLGVESAPELAEVMGAVGLAQNFAAIRALSTHGIQRGHMTLHARSVAMAAGASESVFDDVVDRLIAAGDIKVWKAREIIADLEDSQRTHAPGRNDRQEVVEHADAAGDIGYGKIILLGEHSVVYGRHAIAAPIPLHIRAEVKAQREHTDLMIPRWGVEMRLSEPERSVSSLHASITLIAERLGLADRGMRIDVFPHIPRANGLGASAALAVAVIRAMARCFEVEISEREISNLAFDCEKIAHGTPSGIDNTLATFGRPILFRKENALARAEIRDLTTPAPIPVVIGLSGVATLTMQTVGSVRAAWEKNPARYESIFSQIDALALAGAQALKQGDIAELGELMNIDHGLLNALQVSSREIEELVEIARRNGALGAKLTGGGGGGAMIAIAEPERTQTIASAMRSAGYNTFITEIR
ncbi:hydroxymethylglutaryl-CoA reductase, degradative [Salinisphaera sp.]|uniref:hydroxymethylglutaryl-CoA reductase, degradative n=1 Tax=Salinisphaera sp. TaxID=1914330 RepID=UPI000C5ACD46|nr:hydroxymethylglutaryl-CoA reductase, degradative [Salinisphaera sp.]MAS10392.1 hydroxymethylglutaryl-CoA reductase [Salinisphaera sp.]|tara:strand:+ start:956 stop:3232 length:2277 start_codon:yes stop_codon:yes gene_type:complete